MRGAQRRKRNVAIARIEDETERGLQRQQNKRDKRQPDRPGQARRGASPDRVKERGECRQRAACSADGGANNRRGSGDRLQSLANAASRRG